MKKLSILFVIVLIISNVYAQKDRRDKSVFVEYKAGFYENTIMKDASQVDEMKKPVPLIKRFKMDYTGLELPNQKEKYKAAWHNNPISQGNAGTCWCFSTTSYFESEVERLTGNKVKISELYSVYWEYVEKARRYVQERGNSVFGEGSEGNAVTRIFKKYGAVPATSYTGLLDGRKFHNHAEMFAEMESYLQSVKANNAWNEELVLSTIKSILNHYIGVPPTEVTIDGQKFTPQQYVTGYLKLKMEDYIEVLSLLQEPYYELVEYKVPDNWWHSKDYYNVPLDVYMKTMKNAIRKGFTVCIGGDVSESGLNTENQCAMVPSYDIPVDYIDENSRQMRFSNHTTTDDHGMHLVGFLEGKDAKDWYLVKDSSAGSRNNDPESTDFGYYFFQEDYVKLKIMGYTIHKDAAQELLKKFVK